MSILIHSELELYSKVRAIGIVCVSSQPFELGIVLHLFCWIPNYVRKIMTNFENCYQPAGPVGKPDHPVH